jgi:hypothetical protein
VVEQIYCVEPLRLQSRCIWLGTLESVQLSRVPFDCVQQPSRKPRLTHIVLSNSNYGVAGITDDSMSVTILSSSSPE